MEQDNKHITEQYVSFETAKLLKDKGFDGDCFVAYNANGNIESAMELYGEETIGNGECGEGDIAAPTQALAMRWLREVKNIHINIYWLSIRKQYHSEIIEGEKGCDDNCDTYEDAVEYALKYCLTKLL